MQGVVATTLVVARFEAGFRVKVRLRSLRGSRFGLAALVVTI